jgi:hypothetical protein
LLRPFDDPIYLVKKVFQQPLRGLKRVRHTLVIRGPVLVVIRQSVAGIFELLRRFYRVSVVIAQNTSAMSVMQRQAIADAVRCVGGWPYTPCFNLDLEPGLLLQDAAIQIKERFKSWVGVGHW